MPMLISACDMGSYNPIARALDPFEPLGNESKGWFFGSGSVGDSYARILLLSEGNPLNGQLGSFVNIRIHDEVAVGIGEKDQTQIVLSRGYYQVSGSNLEMSPVVRYSGTYYQTTSPKNFPAPVDVDGEDYTVPFSGNLVLAGTDYKPIDDVITAIWAAGTARVDEAFILYQIGIYSSQVIIPGFGGPGMMTYTTRTRFNGLVNGSVQVEMPKLLPKAMVNFEYEGQENIPGIVMSDLLQTNSNPSGNGDMAGTVNSTVSGPGTLAVGYDAIVLEGTIPVSGDYSVIIDGSVPQTIDCSAMTPGNLDYAALMN